MIKKTDRYHVVVNFVILVKQFEEENKDIRLKYCGSSNQRVIDIQQSLKSNKIILYEKR